MRATTRTGVAAGLGVCLALAMPPLSWWPLALVAVGGLGVVCRDVSLRLGALAGAAFGFAFMLVGMWWLEVIVPGLQFAIAVAEMPFYALLGLALAAVSRLPVSTLWGACAWLAMEVLRGNVPLGGFPWARLGTAFVDTPVTAWARVLGEGGLTLVVALSALLLASALHGSRRSAVVSVLAGVALLGGSVLLPIGVYGSTGETVTVGVVQGDVPGEGLDSFSEPEVTLRNHVRATHDLAADVRAGEVDEPDLVIWPENASDIDPLLDAEAGTAIQRAVVDVGVPVVVGAVTHGARPDLVQGSGIVWAPDDGPTQQYAKRRLVPFGEFVPFRPALTSLVPMLEEETPRDFVPGDRPGVLDVDGVMVGAVMCFEVAFDAAIRDVAPADVDLLTVQTNNAFYMGSGQLEQQWAITRLRAVETGRAVAVAATTGISGVIAPDGSVIDRTFSRDRQVIVEEVPTGQGRTAGVRVGGALEVVALVVAALATVVAVVRGRGKGRAR